MKYKSETEKNHSIGYPLQTLLGLFIAALLVEMFGTSTMVSKQSSVKEGSTGYESGLMGALRQSKTRNHHTETAVSFPKDQMEKSKRSPVKKRTTDSGIVGALRRGKPGGHHIDTSVNSPKNRDDTNAAVLNREVGSAGRISLTTTRKLSVTEPNPRLVSPCGPAPDGFMELLESAGMQNALDNWQFFDSGGSSFSPGSDQASEVPLFGFCSGVPALKVTYDPMDLYVFAQERQNLGLSLTGGPEEGMELRLHVAAWLPDTALFEVSASVVLDSGETYQGTAYIGGNGGSQWQAVGILMETFPIKGTSLVVDKAVINATLLCEPDPFDGGSGQIFPPCSLTTFFDAYFDDIGIYIVHLSPENSIRQVSSTFDQDDDGWSAVGDFNSVGWDSGLQALKGVDSPTGNIWRFKAPSKFHGSVLDCVLRFELKQQPKGSLINGRDVIVESGGTQLFFDFGAVPETTFTPFNVTFSTNGGWKIFPARTVASPQVAENVFTNIDLLLIRGEYRTGGDTGHLDNVFLTCM